MDLCNKNDKKTIRLLKKFKRKFFEKNKNYEEYN